MPVATGTGWYGSPVQHGAGTCTPHGVISRRRSAALILQHRGQPGQHARAVVVLQSSAERSTVSTWVFWLPTRTRPRESRISPRTAGTTMVPRWVRPADCSRLVRIEQLDEGQPRQQGHQQRGEQQPQHREPAALH